MVSRNYRGVARAVVVVACWSLLVCQVNYCVQLYMRGDSTYSVQEVTGEPLPLPPITFCPRLPYDPRILSDLGLDLDAGTYTELLRRIFALEGVPDETTVAQLVEAAAWRVGDLVQEIQFGDIRETYDGGRHSPDFWTRTLLPWGPCWTLKLPPVPAGINVSITIRDPILGLQQCNWLEDVSFFFPVCEEVSRHCNTTCAWEELIFRSVGVMVISYGLSDTYSLSSSALNFMKSPRYGLQLEPYEVIHVTDSGPHFIMQTCVDYLYGNMTRLNNCTILSSRQAGIPAKSVCSPKEVSPISSLRKDNKCVENHRKVRWKIIQSSYYSNMIIQLKPYMKRFRESLTYPYINLLTDVGGSFGFSVGVALISLWEWIGHGINVFHRLATSAKAFVARRRQSSTDGFVREKRGYFPHTIERFIHCESDKCTLTLSTKIKTVSRLAIMLLLFGMAALHICLSLHDNLIRSRNRITTVTVVPENSANETKYSKENVSLSEAAVSRLASRVLGCRDDPPSRFSCQVTCMLKSCLVFSSGFLPFINVKDLPLCTTDTANVNLEYIVPAELEEYIPDKINVACERRCEGKPTTSQDNKMRFRVVNKRKKSAGDFFYDFGGIMSLYFGYSLLGFAKYAAGYFNFVRNRVRKVAELSVKWSLILLAIGPCFSRASIYLYYQPVLTMVSPRPFVMDMLPSVTVCHWPPFNLSRMLHAVGHPELPDSFYHLPFEEQHREIVSTLEHLQENASQLLAHAWQSALWDLRDDISNLYWLSEGKKSAAHREMIRSTPLGSCYTVTSDHEFIKQKRVDLEMYLLSKVSDHGSYLYFTVHRQGEPPAFIKKPTVNLGKYQLPTYEINTIAEYEGVVTDRGGSYGRCVHECIEVATKEAVGCTLTQPSRDRHSCDGRQLARILAAQWSVFLRTDKLYPRLISKQSVSRCKYSCRNKRQQFYYIKKPSSYPSSNRVGFSAWEPYSNSSSRRIRLRINTQIHEEVVEYVGYTLNQLISDVGGVMGVTMGVSLLSLLTFIIDLARICFSRQNQVDEG